MPPPLPLAPHTTLNVFEVSFCSAGPVVHMPFAFLCNAFCPTSLGFLEYETTVWFRTSFCISDFSLSKVFVVFLFQVHFWDTGRLFWVSLISGNLTTLRYLINSCIPPFYPSNSSSSLPLTVSSTSQYLLPLLLSTGLLPDALPLADSQVPWVTLEEDWDLHISVCLRLTHEDMGRLRDEVTQEEKKWIEASKGLER